jgi:transposase-like protein
LTSNFSSRRLKIHGALKISVMVRYSSEFKYQIGREMLWSNSQSHSQISRANGIAAPTL